MAYDRTNQRKIIHIDMDAFYAAVEARDQPRLAEVPLIVGGERGVVLTANYLARQYGVRSGMPCFIAKEKCASLVFVKPRFEAYKEVSQTMHQILRKYVDDRYVEGLSLDEAYLDVTNAPTYAVKIAQSICLDIYNETQLTCSAGVSVNKMLAKIASDYRKPNSITVVQPHQVREFMAHLPLRKIPGIGRASEQKLSQHNLNACCDVWQWSLYRLVEVFGLRYGKWLFKKTRGIDLARVGGRRGVRKSVGKERTIGNGVHSFTKLQGILNSLTAKLSHFLTDKSLKARTITLKLKYRYDEQITRSHTFDSPLNNEDIFKQELRNLLLKTEAGKSNVRLVGVSLSNLI